ncbi:sulfatase [Candidatus Omnitrophota bacterium]
MKNKLGALLDIVSVFVVVSFIKAIFSAMSLSISNQYFDYKMYRMIVYCFQNAISQFMLKGISMVVLVYVVLLVSIFLIKKLCVPVFQSTLSLKIKDSKRVIRIIAASFFVLLFLIYDGWVINALVLPKDNFILRLLFNSLILPIAILFWLIFIQGRWENVLSFYLKIKPFVIKTIKLVALSFIVALLIFNLFYEIYQRNNAPIGPNIIFIQLETLRPDRLNCYGYSEDTSPNITQLAQDGILFKNAISPSSWTFPAVTSMLTGFSPSSLGIGHKAMKIDGKVFLMAEMLMQEGYRTHGITYSSYISPEYGFLQGFDDFEHHHVEGNTISSPDITRGAISFLKKNKNRKFFLYLFYHDPHLNYIMHEEFNYYSDYSGKLISGEPIGERFTGDEPNENTSILSSDDMNFLLSCYDSEISFTDKHIGMVLDELKRLGLYEDALIIITADHGEEFNEKGRLGHSYSVYQTLIHVPLIIKAPNGKSAQIDTYVSTMDLMPSLLYFLGIELMHEVDGEIIDFNDLELTRVSEVFSEVVTPSDGKAMYCVIDEEKKLILDTESASYELYNLKTDPFEERNIYESNIAIAKPLKKKLDKWLYDRRKRKKELGVEWSRLDYSFEARKRLKALGYLQ